MLHICLAAKSLAFSQRLYLFASFFTHTLAHLSLPPRFSGWLSEAIFIDVIHLLPATDNHLSSSGWTRYHSAWQTSPPHIAAQDSLTPSYSYSHPRIIAFIVELAVWKRNKKKKNPLCIAERTTPSRVSPASSSLEQGATKRQAGNTEKEALEWKGTWKTENEGRGSVNMRFGKRS